MTAWRKSVCGLVALASLTASAVAQPAAPAAEPQTLWGWLGLSKKNKIECKDKFCKSPAGDLAGGMIKPMSILTGGVIPGCCDKPSLIDLAKPDGSAEGAAARIKKSEAEAKARRAAIRYLGTVDCRWHQEAQAALIAALLTDPNECVRYEAALSLANGCCCTPKVIEALEIVVEAKPKEGFPPENSERVREMAMIALNNCRISNPEKPKDGETPKEEGVEPAKYGSANAAGNHEVAASGRIPTGQRSLSGVFQHAFGSTPAKVTKSEDMRPMKSPVESKMAVEPTPASKPATPGKPQLRPVDDFPGVIDLPDGPEKPAMPEPLVTPPARNDEAVKPVSYQPKKSATPAVHAIAEALGEPVQEPEPAAKSGKSLPTGKRSVSGLLSNAFSKKK